MISNGLFPEQSVSGVCGPIGVGCTRWILKSIHDWQHGKPILGVSCPPTPYLYVPVGMAKRQVISIITGIGVEISPIRFIASSAASISAVFADLPAGIKLVVIENAQELLLSGKINDFRDASDFMNQLQDISAALNIAIVITVEAGKQRTQGGSPTHPRQRILGSSQFGRKMSGFVFIDYLAGATASERRLLNLPSLGVPREWRIEFDSAGVPHTAGAPLKGAESLELWFSELEEGVEIMFRDVVEAAKALGVSRATAGRWKSKAEREGRLRPIAHGVYTKPKPS